MIPQRTARSHHAAILMRMESRTVTFPKQRRPGRLYARPHASPPVPWGIEEHLDPAWRLFAHAQGQVLFPPASDIYFALQPQATRNLRFLADLPPDSLTVLSLVGGAPPASELIHLHTLHRLRTLLMSHARHPATALAVLVGMESLAHLDVGFSGLDAAGLAQVCRLSGLRSLDIDSAHAHTTDLQLLTQLPSLEALNLGYVGVGADGMAAVGALRRLRAIRFWESGRIWPSFRCCTTSALSAQALARPACTRWRMHLV
jgi:hypothetical protein